MCECAKREDGTWHVDECCAWIMDAYHGGGLDKLWGEIVAAMTNAEENSEQWGFDD